MKRAVFPLALVTTVFTFVLLLIGGTVNPTGSSLACPDWPTCYGSFFPEMKDGVQYEHTHRIVATLVGVLTVALSVVLWRLRPASRINRVLAVSAIAAVCLQGLLGGLTVLLRLPVAVSAAHLALSMLFFCLLLYLTWRVRPGALPSAPGRATSQAARILTGLATAGVYLQILLGGLVRHTRSGRACHDDFPWCQGSVWPDWGPAQLHMLHRYFGAVVVLLVLAAAWVAYAHARRSNRMAVWLAATAPGIVSLQFLLGVLTVTSSIGLLEVTAHLGVGALLLADLFCLTLALGARSVAEQRAALSREKPQMHPHGALS